MLQNDSAINGALCELGVWHGKSLILLSLFRKPDERCFGYDLFPGDLKERAFSNIQKFGNPNSVELVSGNLSSITHEQLAQRIGMGVRILHIDAGHEYHEVMHQLMQFAPFVLPGGVIIMDDYHDREFPGIEAATLDFAEIDRPRRFVPFFAGGNKMYLCEPNHATGYQRGLLSIEPIASSSRVSRVRDFTILVGYSKLPVSRDECLRQIDELAFPLPYTSPDTSLQSRAARFSQINYGSVSV